MPIIVPNVAPPAIVMLETIGQNAALRHASKYDLAQALAEMGASEGLKLAAASGDQGALKQELGSQANQYPNHPSQNLHDDGMWNPDGEIS